MRKLAVVICAFCACPKVCGWEERFCCISPTFCSHGADQSLGLSKYDGALKSELIDGF